jgi:hypothetical protein
VGRTAVRPDGEAAGGGDDVDRRDFRDCNGPEQRALLGGPWQEGMRSAPAPPPAAEGAVEAAAAVLHPA